MQAKREQWKYRSGERVWVGKYRNSHNMPHWHYDCELLVVEKGKMDIFCNDTVYSLSEGDAMFINSKQVHYMHALTPETVNALIVFDYDIIKPFSAELTLEKPVLSCDYGIPALFEELKARLLARELFYEKETEHLVALKIIEIFRSEARKSKSRNETSVERVKALLEEIDEKYEFFDLESAAGFVGMNPAYFSRYFHKLTGMTFSQYLNYVKTEHAVGLLTENSDMPITEVSIRCGFATIRNFNRVFKEFTGYTPKTLPHNFVMKDSFFNLNENSANPTLQQSVLLESSDSLSVSAS